MSPGKRRDALAVGSHHAPGLAGQEFELAFGQIDPVQPQAEDVRVAADRQTAVGRIADLTQKVRLPVAEDFPVVVARIDARADARVLNAEPRFGQRPSLRVAVGNAAEIGADAGSRIGGSAETDVISMNPTGVM